MSQADEKPIQNWREIAARVAAETDPNKVTDLAEELISALDESSNRQYPRQSARSNAA
jgi:phage terminase Nu1 subunit (DNA packaging protein)